MHCPLLCANSVPAFDRSILLVRFGIILFLAIPITANDSSNLIGLRSGPRGQDRLKSRISLVYHDLHSNFLESGNLFAFQVRTPPDPLHPLKTKRNGEWLFSGQVSKLWPDIAFNLDYWNYEISINSFELRKRERERFEIHVGRIEFHLSTKTMDE